jgi:hypothetical protein
LRGGNLPSLFDIPHWIRDRRLSFSPNTVTLAPSARNCDAFAGDFPILEDGGRYDVIIAGSGMSGLAAAFYLQRRRPGTRVLLIDTNHVLGGSAQRDDADPIPTPASTAGAYAVVPYADFLEEIYGTVGIDWDANTVQAPFYSYWFDDRNPYALPGARGWVLDAYSEKGIDAMPYPAEIRRQLHDARQDFRNWYVRHGSPTDPADNGDPRYDYLAQMTLHDYLTQTKGFSDAVSDFFTRYAVDALAGSTRTVNAYSSISFLGAEYGPLFAFPGGTSGIARHIAAWLIPGLIAGSPGADLINNPIREDLIDHPDNAVRIRQRATVLRADTSGNEASVIYFRDGQFHRARAKAVICAGQSHTSKHLAEHLMGADQRAAWDFTTQVPVVIANVTLRNARALVDTGVGYNQYWWGGRYFADFVTADWAKPNRLDPERSTVLTFYGGNELPPEDMPAERGRLLSTPFGAYEDSLREDTGRMFSQVDFDFDRDVSALYVYRWGHAMVYPKVGTPFGPPQLKAGRTIRTPAPRHIARQQLGRISFAGQDTESTPAIESAIGSGLRTALEAIALL